MTEYEGYSEGIMQFKGSISGIAVEYNGTLQVSLTHHHVGNMYYSNHLQEVFDQFSRDNPGIAVELNQNVTTAGKLESRSKVSRYSRQVVDV